MRVSEAYSARTEAGRHVYDFLDAELRPGPGTPLPEVAHVAWHDRTVFKGTGLAA